MCSTAGINFGSSLPEGQPADFQNEFFADIYADFSQIWPHIAIARVLYPCYKIDVIYLQTFISFDRYSKIRFVNLIHQRYRNVRFYPFKCQFLACDLCLARLSANTVLTSL